VVARPCEAIMELSFSGIMCVHVPSAAQGALGEEEYP
jgi:hypothetical protein